jgi:hypothetical protein
MYNSRPTIFEHFVKACIANNGGVIDEDEEAVTAKLGGLIKYLSGGSLRADFFPSFFFLPWMQDCTPTRTRYRRTCTRLRS